MHSNLDEIRIGQIWKDKRKNPRSAFAVIKTYERQYADGSKANRIVGALCSLDYADPDRDIDERSMRKMFPYLLFEEKDDSIEENK